MQTYSPIAVLTGKSEGLTEPRRIGCEHEGATRGHAATQPGLRGHSIGDAYPWRVVGYGDGSWGVVNARGRVVASFYPRPEDPADHHLYLAHAQARAFKALHPLGYVEDGPSGPANISGPLDEIPGRLEGRLLVLYYENGGSDKLRVVGGWDQGLVKVLNHNTGKLSLVSLSWLAHSQYISVSLDITDFI